MRHYKRLAIASLVNQILHPCPLMKLSVIIAQESYEEKHEGKGAQIDPEQLRKKTLSALVGFIGLVADGLDKSMIISKSEGGIDEYSPIAANRHTAVRLFAQ